MNYSDHDTLLINNVEIFNYLPDIGIDKVREEILEGLMARPKYISPKFFYDPKGSQLFEEITRLDGYYPTRTEKQILRTLFAHIHIDFRNLDIIELGSGDASKITLLLNQVPDDLQETISYYPVDISQSAIEKSARELSTTFSRIRIRGIVADFYHQLEMIPKNRRRLFCFLGSTIGNFSPDEAEQFMKLLGSVMQQGDSFILGVDMVKEPGILENAYNDTEGITAEFNLNILQVINKLTGADFDPSAFEHLSFYNPEEQRIEMHLRAGEDIKISIQSPEDPGKTIIIYLDKGECIHTENSYKFSKERIQQLGEWAGLIPQSSISDLEKWFSIIHFIKA